MEYLCFKDEEYTLSCTTLYYAAAPVAGGAFLLFTLTLLIVCHMCRKSQDREREERYRVKYSQRSFLLSVDDRLATINPRANIVRVQPVDPNQQQQQQHTQQQPKNRVRKYGATSST